MPLGYTSNSVTRHIHAQLFSTEYKIIFTYALALFIIPLLSPNQIIVGTAVNALLIKSSITIRTRKVFLLALIPSIAVMGGGILFGGLTSSMLIMIPFIWVANLVLMLLMKKLFVQKNKEYFFSAVISATTKTILLFSVTFGLLAFSLVPAVFLTAFGVLQLITALSGATLVAILKKP